MSDEPLVERVAEEEAEFLREVFWGIGLPDDHDAFEFATAQNGHIRDRVRAILLEVADAVEHNDEVWARIASYPDRSAVAGDGVYEVVRFLREQAAEEGADD